MKKLISCNPAPWNVSMKYLQQNKNSVACLKTLRALPTIGKQRSKLSVSINGVANDWLLGKNGDYWLNGKSLLKTLEQNASVGQNKISIQ